MTGVAWKLRPTTTIPSEYKRCLCVTEVSKKHLPYCYVRETGSSIRNRCISTECQKELRERCLFKNEMIITGCGGW
jgi:hypothetical protein